MEFIPLISIASPDKKFQYSYFSTKSMTISAVQTQGRGNWYNWVTGYHLYYSNDGQRWTGYTKSGDALHSNVSKLYLFAY